MIQLQEEYYKYVIQLLRCSKINVEDLDEGFARLIIEQEVFYLDKDEELKMKPLAHLIFNTIINREISLSIYIQNSEEKETISFFTNKETIVYERNYNKIYQLKWLPHIPMLIGGVSSTLKKAYEKGASVRVEGRIQGKENLDFELSMPELPLDREEIIQTISRWFTEKYSEILKKGSQK